MAPECMTSLPKAENAVMVCTKSVKKKTTDPILPIIGGKDGKSDAEFLLLFPTKVVELILDAIPKQVTFE